MAAETKLHFFLHILSNTQKATLMSRFMGGIAQEVAASNRFSLFSSKTLVQPHSQLQPSMRF